jgi:hypothetical protein
VLLSDDPLRVGLLGHLQRELKQRCGINIGDLTCRNSTRMFSLSRCSALPSSHKNQTKNQPKTKHETPDRSLKCSCLLPALLLLFRKLATCSGCLFEAFGSDGGSFITEGFGALQCMSRGFMLCSGAAVAKITMRMSSAADVADVGADGAGIRANWMRLPFSAVLLLLLRGRLLM